MHEDVTIFGDSDGFADIEMGKTDEGIVCGVRNKVNYDCDVCESMIIGDVYHCQTCEDFTTCSDCHDKGFEHDQTHRFQLMN